MAAATRSSSNSSGIRSVPVLRSKANSMSHWTRNTLIPISSTNSTTSPAQPTPKSVPSSPISSGPKEPTNLGTKNKERETKNQEQSSMKLEIEVPDSAFSALRQAPRELSACLRLMAAAKLYEIGDLSQERAAELAGLSRQDFLISMSHLGVSPFQGVEDDLAATALQS